MGRVIVITSGKGGVGKTTATANIGAGLALKGHSVLVIDTDIGLRNLDLVMGMENRIVFDIVDVIEGRCRARQAVVRDKRIPSLSLLPAAQTKDKTAVNQTQMQDLITEMKGLYEFIIIDSPAGIEQGFKIATVAAEEAIIVTMPEVSAVRDADRVVGLLSAQGITDIKLIINRLRPGLIRKGDMLDVKDTIEILGLELLGVIPDDERLIRATNIGETVVNVPNSKAGAAYRRVVEGILGNKTIDNYASVSSFFAKLLGLDSRAG